MLNPKKVNLENRFLKPEYPFKDDNTAKLVNINDSSRNRNFPLRLQLQKICKNCLEAFKSYTLFYRTCELFMSKYK